MESLKAGIAEICRKNREIAILMGTVVSVAPLSIQARGDDKLTISETALVVPQSLSDHTVEVNASGGRIMLKYGLKVGDEVCLLSYNRGEKYIVLDRVGGS